MALIDFILNLFALLLWLNWLALRPDSPAWTPSVSLVGTLRRADSSATRRWKSLAGLAALLLGRALVYWQLSSQFHWTPRLDLAIIDLHFHLDPALRWDFIARALLFSLLSFALTLLVFYIWLLLLSVVNSSVPDTDPFQKLVRMHFKWLERWPGVLKLLMPFVAGALLWLSLHPVLAWLGILPAVRSDEQILRQAAVIGAVTYLAWKYLIVGILLLHLVNSYVYLGNHAIWNFVNATARNLLWPVRWIPLRLGKVDFLPLVVMALVFFVGEVAEMAAIPPSSPHGFRAWLYHLLPF
jgi:uncharacterized protein YggT (Ycf19 family)